MGWALCPNMSPVLPSSSGANSSGSRSIGIGRIVTLGSGTPLMEVFCFRRVWELLTVEFFDAFTGVAFLVCVGAGGVPLDQLAGVDEEAWRPAVPPPTSR
jgi:hypothetical protein